MAKILANYGGLLMAAMGQTLLLALYGLFFACIIGLVVGLMSVVKNRACNIIATIFVDIIRGVPMIVLAFYVFFAVPMLLNNILHLNTMLGLSGSITLSGLQAGTICLALNCGAYMAEIIRAGIESVDKGQMEAARSLGMSRLLSTRTIILPQALRYILPAIGNELIALLKETAVAGYVAVVDLTRAGNLIRNNTYDAVNPLMIVALSYLAMVIFLTYVLRGFERRLNKDKH